MNKKAETYRSLEELYLDNRKLVFTYFWDYLNDDNLIGALSSEIWLKVSEHEADILEKDKKWVKNYLRVMVKNLVIDHLRKEKKEQKLINDIIELNKSWSNTEEKCFANNELFYLEEGIKCLSEDEAELISMHFKYNMSSQQIAEALGISAGAVRVRQTRVIAKMRKRIITIIREENTDE